MKLKACLLAALIAVVAITGYALYETRLADNGILRLHVVANSDSPADQAVKLAVRDGILAELAGRLDDCNDRSSAEARLTGQAQQLESLANDLLAKEGFDYGAVVTLGDAEFPTKMYGNRVYPAGRYRALRVELGAAAGKNWWCVLFPPLCFVDLGKNIAVAETRESALTAEDGLETERLQFRSKLLEYILDDQR